LTIPACHWQTDRQLFFNSNDRAYAQRRGGKNFYGIRKKVKEADLYSAFIEVPYTQGAEVRITQCYLQITPYLPLSHKHSPDGTSQTEVADI